MLAFAKDLMSARGARRTLTCVLLEKPHKRAVAVSDCSCRVEFIGAAA